MQDDPDRASSDDDRQPDDVGERGTLGEEGRTPRRLPPRVSGSPRELLDLELDRSGENRPGPARRGRRSGEPPPRRPGPPR